MSATNTPGEINQHNLERTVRAQDEEFSYCVIPTDGDKTIINIRNNSSIAANRDKIESDETDHSRFDHIHTVTVENNRVVHCTCKDYKYRCDEFNSDLETMVELDAISEEQANEARKECKHGRAVEEGELDDCTA